MDYLVLRYLSFKDGETSKECTCVGHFNTRWEAERACAVFRDDHPTNVLGEAMFIVVDKKK
jgi:hypothetical protein